MKHRLLALALALVAAAHIALADPALDPAVLFKQGQAAFEQKRYAAALAAWEQAYAISHLAPLLYNLAQAYRLRGKPGDCTTARADYQRFVEVAPPSPERDLATSYIAELATCDKPVVNPKPAPVAPAPPREPPPSASVASIPLSTSTHVTPSAAHGRTIGGVVLGVAGVGLLATGIAFGHHASVLGADVTQACAVSCDWTAEKARDSAGRRDAALGWAFDSIGAAALVGSVVLIYFGVREHGVTVAPVGAGPGATLVWSGTW